MDIDVDMNFYPTGRHLVAYFKIFINLEKERLGEASVPRYIRILYALAKSTYPCPTSHITSHALWLQVGAEPMLVFSRINREGLI